MALKDEILNILIANPDTPVSGEVMGETLGVTRAGIWKAIKALREEGCPVESHPNRGYILTGDYLSVQGILSALGETERAIILKDTVTSTNTLGLDLAREGAANGTVVIAREQTKGRGRHGRSFFAPRDKGLYMTMIFRPEASPEEAQVYTIAAAVAVCKVIENLTPARPQIKWVNDIFVDGKKVCGILTEAVANMETNSVDTIILGIGINLTIPPGEFPGEFRAAATSLFPNGVTRNTLAAKIIREIETLIRDINARDIMENYRQRCFILGREIEFTHQGQIHQGVARDINSRGNLIVDTPTGTETLYGGEISLRSDNFSD